MWMVHSSLRLFLTKAEQRLEGCFSDEADWSLLASWGV
jgi:hypothetical protein